MGIVESAIDLMRQEVGGCVCIEPPNDPNIQSNDEGEEEFEEDNESLSSVITDGDTDSDTTDEFEDSEDEPNEKKYTGEYSVSPSPSPRLTDKDVSNQSTASRHSIKEDFVIEESEDHEHSIHSATATFTQTLDTIPYGGPSATVSSLPVHAPMIEFPISSSSGLDEPIPSDLEAIVSRKEEEAKLPKSSKLIIGLSHLLANVLKEYFESLVNQCEFGSIDVEGILQHVIITGDAPRNYLLDVPMNNTLDIIVVCR